MLANLRLFKRKASGIPLRNPWLDIEHDHDWLEANHGAELVCGLCGERKNNAKKKS
jgi:hypothetical protein